MRVPTVLTIAGSDSGAGAGVQADLKTFVDHRVYGVCVITAITAQNTLGVHRVQTVDPELVRDQLRAVFDDFDVAAIKTGMLADGAVARVVVDTLRALPQCPPLVVDPVLVSSSGTALLDDAGVQTLRRELIPLATVVTPNGPEADLLGSIEVPMLRTGGHDRGRYVRDRLIHSGCISLYDHRRVTTRNSHGTGCTLSAAIAARLAHGDALDDACRRAIRYVSNLLVRSRHGVGRGNGPLLHGLRHR